MYNEVGLWYEPRRILENVMDHKSEMTKTDHGFLCGLIRDKKPKKYWR